MLREKFARPLDRAALALSASTVEDARLLRADLWGSRVHVRMLGETGLLPLGAARRLDRALAALERAAVAGRFTLRAELEDVHLNVEEELTRRLPDDGPRLHTGRSRNDQVATDLAVYLRGALLELEGKLAELVGSLLAVARGPAGRHTVVGWTHYQPAQRVYVGQILGTHALRFLRDADRLAAIRGRLTDGPLGSGALAGSSLPLDRRRTARLLGFARPSPSSLDAVSDRDAAVETLSALALFSVHASGLAEELVVGAMPEVGRVRLADPFVTTSSLMPHKRNPDLAELVRAESGPALGRLTAHLALLKGLPLAYNRDLQVGKPLLFDGVARAALLLDVLAPMVATADFRPSAGGPTGPEGETASVELVDALVAAGVPFRTAHVRVARLLARPEMRGRDLRALTAAEIRRDLPELASVSFRLPPPDQEPELRSTEGGSSRRSLDRLLAEVARRKGAVRRDVAREARRLARLRSELDRPIRSRARAL